MKIYGKLSLLNLEIWFSWTESCYGLQFNLYNNTIVLTGTQRQMFLLVFRPLFSTQDYQFQLGLRSFSRLLLFDNWQINCNCRQRNLWLCSVNCTLEVRKNTTDMSPRKWNPSQFYFKSDELRFTNSRITPHRWIKCSFTLDIAPCFDLNTSLNGVTGI